MTPEQQLILMLDQEIEAELKPFTQVSAPPADPRKAQRRSYALRAVKRYFEFLLIIQARNAVASAEYLLNVREQRDETERQLKTGLTTWRRTARERDLERDWYQSSLQVQLEQESFYIFAKMLLDKVAQAVGVYFGQARGCSYQSHDALTKCFERYCELLGFPEQPQLFESMLNLKSDVCDFRDKVISHEKSARSIVMRPLVEDADGTLRLSLNYVYPREGDRAVQGRSPNELPAEIGNYILRTLKFLRAPLAL